MNKRYVLFFLGSFFFVTLVLSAAFCLALHYKQEDATVSASKDAQTEEESPLARKLRERREHPEEFEEPPKEKPEQTRKKDRETGMKVKSVPPLATKEELEKKIAAMEQELAEQRQKCDDRAVLVDLRLEMQDITAIQHKRDIAKINLRKEQYTAAVMRGVLTLLQEAPFITAEEKAAQSQPYEERRAEAQSLYETYKTMLKNESDHEAL